MPNSPAAGLTILVAEDDPTVAAFVNRVLQEEGYIVLTAPDGAAALAALRAGPDPVDLLLTDIRMPRLNGDRLAFQALELGLTRHVLFISGYEYHPEAAQMMGDLLMKPFLPGALIEAVARALGGPTPHQTSPPIRKGSGE